MGSKSAFRECRSIIIRVQREDDLKYTQVPTSPPSLLASFTPLSLCVYGYRATPLLVSDQVKCSLFSYGSS